MSETIIVHCSSCGAGFKIKHPQSGATFSCNRCQSCVCIPGSLSHDEEAREKPEILKIELPKNRPAEDGADAALPVQDASSSQRIARVKEEEDALLIKNQSSERLTKKIFACDIQNRERLLYLISLYSEPGSGTKKGKWLRELPLQVFMFEGVVDEIFDWDYAPSSVFTAEGRCFLNISQEGGEDLFSLLSGEYLYTLKLSTNQHRNIAAYQVSPKGIKYAASIRPEEKAIIDKLVQCPKCFRLLNIVKKGNAFYLSCEGKECGYERKSSITEAEDVSYFCIPYFPESLSRFQYVLPISAKKRMEKYFKSKPQDNIKDKLEELIYFSNVKIVVGEWIPFGSNHMAALNYKLGSNERIQSAKFTQEIDTFPDGTVVEVPESLTLVKVKDYNLAGYVDFEALIYLPEDPRIVQIEEFGVHIDFTGAVRYGLEVLAINERNHERISLDHLPRLAVDILQDSTSIMDTLLTAYQKSLLELIFQNKARYRDKYFFVLASDIHCFEQTEGESVSAELMRILSQANYQNELNQITEEVKQTALFPDGTVLIVGSHGSILVTRTPEKYERLVADFLFVMDVELFLNNFFARLFLMNDELKDIQYLIATCETDPTAISTVQHKLSRTSGDAILMEEVRGYLEDAVEIFKQGLQKREYDSDMDEAVHSFDIVQLTQGVEVRIKDIRKIIHGTQECLEGLTGITEVISERQMRRIQETLSQNTRNLEDITKTNERSGMSLRILEIIMAGSLAFNIVDQFTGEWSVSEYAALRPLLQKISDFPGMWLFFSMALWALFALGIFRLMRWLEEINAKAIAARIKLDLPCDIQALDRFLETKNVVTHDADIFHVNDLIKVSWEEEEKREWGGNRPRLEMVYDKKNGFLLSLLIEVNRPARGTNVEELHNKFFMDLKKAGVLSSPRR